MFITARENRRKHFFCTFIITLTLIFISAIYPAYGANTLNLAEGDEWRLFKGTHEPSKLWNSRGFDDSSWQKSPSGFGYGDGTHNTVLDDMKGKYKSVYVRYEFIIENYHRITRMVLSIVCDGPFVAYLNNIEAIRSRRPQKGDPLNLIGFTHELDSGKNVISVKCSNDSIDSDDYLFIPSFKFAEE